MANRKPKLGDVQYQRVTGMCPYNVQYFCGGHWTDFSGESRLSDAKFEQAALAFALSAVIREARESDDG